MSLYVKQYLSADKPNLVLLHGWGMSSDVWGAFAETLADYFSLTLIDLPGLGRSTDYPTPYTMKSVVEQLTEQVPEKASWLGWSMGGQIAVEFAATYPQRVEKLITVASNPCFVQRDDWSCAVEESVHQQFETSLDANIGKTLQRFIMLQTQGAELGRETLKFLKAILKELDHAAPIESLSLLRGDARASLSQLTMPVLQLFGEKDNLVPLDAAEACQQLSKGGVKVYSDAGHLPFYSHQTEVIADVVSFLQEPAV